jgi:hypothetical protein
MYLTGTVDTLARPLQGLPTLLTYFRDSTLAQEDYRYRAIAWFGASSLARSLLIRILIPYQDSYQGAPSGAP